MEKHEELFDIFENHTKDLAVDKPVTRSVELALALAEHAVIALLVSVGVKVVDRRTERKKKELFLQDVRKDLTKFIGEFQGKAGASILGDRKEDVIRAIAASFQEDGFAQSDSQKKATMIYHDLESFLDRNTA